jgi:hypothetical protein
MTTINSDATPGTIHIYRHSTDDGLITLKTYVGVETLIVNGEKMFGDENLTVRILAIIDPVTGERRIVQLK